MEALPPESRAPAATPPTERSKQQRLPRPLPWLLLQPTASQDGKHFAAPAARPASVFQIQAEVRHPHNWPEGNRANDRVVSPGHPCFVSSTAESFSFNRWRALIKRVRTELSGMFIISAISAEFSSCTVESSSGWRKSSGSAAIICASNPCICFPASCSSAPSFLSTTWPNTSGSPTASFTAVLVRLDRRSRSEER